MAKKGKSRSQKQRPQSKRLTPARRPTAPVVRTRVDDVPLGEVVTVNHSQEWSGPLPAPADMAAFDAVKAGFAERIMRCHEIPFEMAQLEQVKRHALESKVITSDIRRSWAGLFIGGLIMSGISGSGIVLITKGYNIEGLGITGSGIGAMLSAYFKGTTQRRQHLAEREAISEQQIQRRSR